MQADKPDACKKTDVEMSENGQQGQSIETDQEPTDELKTRFDGKRKHRRSDQNEDSIILTDEMETFIANQFMEETGARVFCSDLYGMFTRSRKTGQATSSKLEETTFNRRCRTMFRAHWKNSKYTHFKHKRCYLNVAAKAAKPQ
jgi:hypothetical protein